MLRQILFSIREIDKIMISAAANAQRINLVLLLSQFPIGRSVMKANLLVQVGAAFPACGSAMVKRTVKMERMNSSVVNIFLNLTWKSSCTIN